MDASKSKRAAAGLCGAVGLATAWMRAQEGGRPLAFASLSPFQLGAVPAQAHSSAAPAFTASRGSAVAVAAVAAVAAGAHGTQRRPRGALAGRRATVVEAESKTDLAPWEIEEETEKERQDRYAREADEMKLKWDARRLEEKYSAQRRQAYSQREQERASMYGPRDLIEEAYQARLYEEARVIEVRRRQREVYERIKALKAGKPLPPKGKPYVELKPLPVRPAMPDEFDISGHYKPQEDIEARKYMAPKSYVSSAGGPPPPSSERGIPKAAWESPQYSRAMAASQGTFPEPGSLPENHVPAVRARVEKQRAEHKAKPRRFSSGEDTGEVREDADYESEVVVAAPAAKAKAATPSEPKASNLPYTKDEVEAMTVPQLKAALQEADMPITGKKSDLLQRLLGAI